MLKSSSVEKKKNLNSKVLKPSSVEPVKQWPRGSSLLGCETFHWGRLAAGSGLQLKS